MATLPPPFHLVTDTLSEDVVECLEQLAVLARGKHPLTGLVFAAMTPDRGIITNCAGECARNPRWARAMTLDLDDYLRRRLQAVDGTTN